MSAPASNVSRPAQRLVPYGLQTRQVAFATLYTEGSDGFVAYTAASIAIGWSDPVPGWDLHLLLSSAFHGAHEMGSRALRRIRISQRSNRPVPYFSAGHGHASSLRYSNRRIGTGNQEVYCEACLVLSSFTQKIDKFPLWQVRVK